jgi:hypothetical protein
MVSKSFAAASGGKRKASSGDKSNSDSRTKKPRIASTAHKRRPFEEEAASDSSSDAPSDDGEGGVELTSRPKYTNGGQGQGQSNNAGAREPGDKGLFPRQILAEPL